MRFLLVCACAGVLHSGCDSGQPSSAASTSTPIGPSVQDAMYTVSGIVRAGGVPIAGARVAVLADRHSVPATSDASGYYAIRASPAQPWGLSPLLSASHLGYFADTRFTDPDYRPIFGNMELQ